MARRTLARGSSLIVSLLVLCAVSFAAHAQPAVVRVVSRMSHGGNQFDIAMPQTGEGGIECRSVATGVNIVVTFDKPVNAGTAAVSAGTATVNGAPAFSGSTMTVALTGVANAQVVTLTLTNVTDTQGGTLASASVFFRVLEADVNGTGDVSVGDVNLVKFHYGKLVSYATFRADINKDNTVTTGDINFAKARNLTRVGGPAVNTPPTITNVPDQGTPGGTAMTPVSFTIGDAESAPAMLDVSAVSSDTTLVPNANISITGSGATRSIGITPALDAGSQPLTGTATITVTVSDGVMVTRDTFLLTVGTPQKLYVASLRPEDDATITPGSGSATLLVNAAETQAVLRFSYSNLTTNKTGAHVHGPADPGQNAGILFDIDVATPQADGSYLWVFQQSGTTTVQDIRDAFHAGRLYLNVHSAKYPNGEIRGHFNFAAGSTTFTPPQPPPPSPAAPPPTRTPPASSSRPPSVPPPTTRPTPPRPITGSPPSRAWDSTAGSTASSTPP